MDSTGNMGPYIKEAHNRIRLIVDQIAQQSESDVRFALITYMDHPPEDRAYVTKIYNFTPSVSRMNLG